MKKILITTALLLCFAVPVEAQSNRGYIYHSVSIVDGTGKPVTDISSVNIYAPGTTTAITAYSDRGLANAITLPMTTSSTNTTLNQSLGTFSFWGTATWDYSISNGRVSVTNQYTESMNSSKGQIVFPRDNRNLDQSTICLFTTNPVTSKIAGGAATGTGGDENVMSIDGVNFEYHILGTQSILAPSLAVGGLNIGMDQTDDDGVEIGEGITSQSPSAFTIGTDAFFIKVSIDIADMNGTDDCLIGFRTAEAYQASVDNYNNMAALNVIDANVFIETIDDNAATTTTDTTDRIEDGVETELAVYVSAAGVVTYTIAGSAPSTTAAFTWDDADTVVPFIYLLNDAGVVGVALLTSYECGLQD